jgi:hypothetical protein
LIFTQFSRPDFGNSGRHIYVDILILKQIRENNDQNYENEILKYYKECHENI